jgi:hypothetical protein
MIRPGKTWLDTDGNVIQAHGGGVNFFNGRYYWYGENKTGCSAKQSEGKPWHAGANCYSSSDLYNWTFEGTVLPATSPEFGHELNPRRIMDRPHVLFNKANGIYVMWMKLVPANWQDQHVGIATSPSPTGPFTLKKILHPNGMCAGDANLFAEASDGKAYYVFGRPHTEVVVADLTPDYLDTTGMYSCHFPQPGDPWGREAPAIFKHKHTYYMITSGTTGYRANEAQWASAPLIHGPWTVHGNPCIGVGSGTTFDSQITVVFEVADRPGCFIAMADRWNSEDIEASTYVWLPLQFRDGILVINWFDEWDLSWFEKKH